MEGMKVSTEGDLQEYLNYRGEMLSARIGPQQSNLVETEVILDRMPSSEITKLVSVKTGHAPIK